MKTEFFGYIAMLVVIVSVLIRKQRTMRIVNTISCAMFVIYGILISSYPIVIMNGTIICINIYYIKTHDNL